MAKRDPKQGEAVDSIPNAATYLRSPPDEAVMWANYQKAVFGLGRISVEFQRLETVLKLGIGLLIDPGDRKVGTILTAQLSFVKILDTFGALYAHRFHDADEWKELNLFLAACHKAEARRNQIIHSHWRLDKSGGKGAILTKSTARKELRRHEEVLSEAGVAEEFQTLQTLTKTFFAVWLPRIAQGGALVQKPRYGGHDADQKPERKKCETSTARS
jgi:hypothetical protein